MASMATSSFSSSSDVLPTESTSGEGYPEDSGDESSWDEGTGKDLICSWVYARVCVCVEGYIGNNF